MTAESEAAEYMGDSIIKGAREHNKDLDVEILIGFGITVENRFIYGIVWFGTGSSRESLKVCHEDQS